MKFVLIPCLILVGLLLTYIGYRQNSTTYLAWSVVIICPTLLLTLLILPARRFAALLHSIDSITQNQRRVLTILIFVVSFIYFYTTSSYYLQGMHPRWHDDQMHAVQIQLLSVGKLWAQPHPMSDFFDTFHIFMKPVYAPIHFLGTAILNVSGVWLHLPIWFIPMCLSSAACALSFHVASKLIPISLSLLAPLFLLSNSMYWMIATMIMSHNSMVFLGLLWLGLFIRFATKPTWGCALLHGVVGGLAMITRPIDALAFLIPIGLGICFVFYRDQLYKRLPRLIAMISLIIAGALPFLSLQLVFDKGVTGHWFTPPYKAYNDIFHPYTTYGEQRFENGRDSIPIVSPLKQKQDYYVHFMLYHAFKYAKQTNLNIVEERIARMLGNTLPDFSLYFILPFGLIRLNNLNKIVCVAPALFYFLLYYPHFYYLPHYQPIIGICVSIIFLMGIQTIVDIFRGEAGQKVFLALYSVSLMLAIGLTRPFGALHPFAYNGLNYRAVNFTHEIIPNLISKPALIFYQYKSDICNFHDEPVYNYEKPNIDDQSMVLAQSLGSRNIELVEYYHKLGQNRMVYVVDRVSMTLYPIGTVDEIIQTPALLNPGS